MFIVMDVSWVRSITYFLPPFDQLRASQMRQNVRIISNNGLAEADVWFGRFVVTLPRSGEVAVPRGFCGKEYLL